MSHERQEPRLTLERVIVLAKEVVLQRAPFVPMLIVNGSENLAVVEVTELPETHESRLERMRNIGREAAGNEEIGTLESVFFVTAGWLGMAEVLVISSLEPNNHISHIDVFRIVRDADYQSIQFTDFRPQAGSIDPHGNPMLQEFATAYTMSRLSRS